MHSQFFEKADVTTTYRQYIANLKSRGIHDYIEIIKNLLDFYISSKQSSIYNHVAYCEILKTLICANGYRPVLSWQQDEIEQISSDPILIPNPPPPIYIKVDQDSLVYKVTDPAGKVQTDKILLSELPHFKPEIKSIIDLLTVLPIIMQVTAQRGHTTKSKFGIIEIIREVRRFINAVNSIHCVSFDNNDDFQILFNEFMSEYNKSSLIFSTALPDKFINIAQHFENYKEHEVAHALSCLSALIQDPAAKRGIVERLILPILERQDLVLLRRTIESVLYQFLPLDNDMCNRLGLLNLDSYPVFEHFAKVSPTNPESQRAIVGYFTKLINNAYLPIPLTVLVEIYPYITDENLKKSAENIIFQFKRSPHSKTINALISRLADTNSKDWVIKLIENDARTLDKLFHYPISIKLGCAYLRTKGFTETDIKAKLSTYIGKVRALNEGESDFDKFNAKWTAEKKDCVLTALVGFHENEAAVKLNYWNEIKKNVNGILFEYIGFIAEYPEFAVVYGQELIDGIIIVHKLDPLTEFRSFDAGEHARKLACIALRNIAKNNPELQLRVTDCIIKELPGRLDLIPLDELIPPEHYLTDPQRFNALFDKLIHSIGPTTDIRIHHDVYDLICHFVNKLPLDQFNQFNEKIKSAYPTESSRTDWCLILMTFIEQRREHLCVNTLVPPSESLSRLAM